MKQPLKSFLARSFSIAILSAVCLPGVSLAQLGDSFVPTDKVRIYWNFGATELELFGNESPLHVANFLGYVDRDDYDNTYIHRSISGSARFLQGGGFYTPAPTFAALLSPVGVPSAGTVVNEFDPTNGLTNTVGTIAAARLSDPDSASSQWFINITENGPGFDPGPFTVFGRISSNFDLIAARANDPLLFNEVNVAESRLGLSSTAPLMRVGNENVLVSLLDVVRISLLAGDYNLDNVVDDDDFDLWEANLGSTTALAIDGSGNGVVDQADFEIWQANFGNFIEPNVTVDPTGDFNGDGLVDAADYTVWRDSLGRTDLPLVDVDGSGTVDTGDYEIWRSTFGQDLTMTGSLLAPPTSIPEPTGVALIAIAIATVSQWPLRRHHRRQPQLA